MCSVAGGSDRRTLNLAHGDAEWAERGLHFVALFFFFFFFFFSFFFFLPPDGR